MLEVARLIGLTPGSPPGFGASERPATARQRAPLASYVVAVLIAATD
jgi:hypothetical protein